MEQLKVPFSLGALLVSVLCCYVLNTIRYYISAAKIPVNLIARQHHHIHTLTQFWGSTHSILQ
jgi:hypothetical protein